MSHVLYVYPKDEQLYLSTSASQALGSSSITITTYRIVGGAHAPYSPALSELHLYIATSSQRRRFV